MTVYVLQSGRTDFGLHHTDNVQVFATLAGALAVGRQIHTVEWFDHVAKRTVGMAEERQDGGWCADGHDVWWTIDPTEVGP